MLKYQSINYNNFTVYKTKLMNDLQSNQIISVIIHSCQKYYNNFFNYFVLIIITVITAR